VSQRPVILPLRIKREPILLSKTLKDGRRSIRNYFVSLPVIGTQRVSDQAAESSTLSVPVIVDATDAEAARLQALNAQQGMRAFRPLLIVSGYPVEAVDAWIAGARIEQSSPLFRTSSEASLYSYFLLYAPNLLVSGTSYGRSNQRPRPSARCPQGMSINRIAI
jgi:hypothetical protein